MPYVAKNHWISPKKVQIIFQLQKKKPEEIRMNPLKFIQTIKMPVDKIIRAELNIFIEIINDGRLKT